MFRAHTIKTIFRVQYSNGSSDCGRWLIGRAKSQNRIGRNHVCEPFDGCLFDDVIRGGTEHIGYPSMPSKNLSNRDGEGIKMFATNQSIKQTEPMQELCILKKDPNPTQGTMHPTNASQTTRLRCRCAGSAPLLHRDELHA